MSGGPDRDLGNGMKKCKDWQGRHLPLLICNFFFSLSLVFQYCFSKIQFWNLHYLIIQEVKNFFKKATLHIAPERGHQEVKVKEEDKYAL